MPDRHFSDRLMAIAQDFGIPKDQAELAVAMPDQVMAICMIAVAFSAATMAGLLAKQEIGGITVKTDKPQPNLLTKMMEALKSKHKAQAESR